MTMTKADIVERIYEKVGFSKKEATEVVEAIFELLKERRGGEADRREALRRPLLGDGVQRPPPRQDRRPPPPLPPQGRRAPGRDPPPPLRGALHDRRRQTPPPRAQHPPSDAPPNRRHAHH